MEQRPCEGSRHRRTLHFHGRGGFYKAGANVGEGVKWSADRTAAARLRDGKPVEAISLEEAEATRARLGLPAP